MHSDVLYDMYHKYATLYEGFVKGNKSSGGIIRQQTVLSSVGQ